MSTTYEYSNKIEPPSLSIIHLDVADSEMTDKAIIHCNWEEDTGILEVVFTVALNSADKVILDRIVDNNS